MLAWQSYHEMQTMRKLVRDGVSQEDLDHMDLNSNGEVTMMEFVTYMLIVMGNVDPSDVHVVLNLYERLHKTSAETDLRQNFRRLSRKMSLSHKDFSKEVKMAVVAEGESDEA